jgi:MYXO-CTERM domain-containing protein
MLSCLLAACGGLEAARQALHGQPQASGPVVWVNFGGALLTKVAPGADNAPNDQSELAGTQIPPFDASKVAPDVSPSDAEDSVFDRLKGYYLPYGVTLTTSQPAAPYTMVLVGGTPGLAGQPSGVAGVSPIDCTNANDANVSFAFSDRFAPLYGSTVALAATAAHELGHSFGLEHTDNPADLMFSVDPTDPRWGSYQVFSLAFTTSANFSGYSDGSSEPATEQCGRANPLDNDQILKAALGASIGGDRNPPTLTWNDPPAGVVPLDYTLTFDASDDVGVQKIEIYKEENQVGITLMKVLRQAPYTAELLAKDGESFTLVAEAVDAAGNRTSQSRAFTAHASSPDLAPSPADAGTSDGAAPDMSGHGGSGGCNFASTPPAPVFALAIFGLVFRRRRR